MRCSLALHFKCRGFWSIMGPASVDREALTKEEACQAADDTIPLNDISGLDITATVDNKDLDEAAAVFDHLLKGEIKAKEAAKQPVLQGIKKILESFKVQCATASRTSKLWFQYMEMVDLLRMAIKAERTGNFSLHLLSVAKMLPFFAASGHNLYTKSAKLYLQQMTQLQQTHPDVFDNFQTGHHLGRVVV